MTLTPLLALAALPVLWGYPCSFPDDMSEFALIAESDAKIEAKSVTPGIFVGLVFQQILLDNVIEVNGVSYIRDIQADNIHWNAGLRIGSSVPDAMDFKHYEFLAENLEPSESDTGQVFVLNDSGGGCWSNEDFGTTGPGETLVVFNTWMDICLYPSDDGSPFFPTVIAPFSRVELDSRIGTVNATIVAREIIMTGSDQEQFKSFTFNGFPYDGELSCRETPSPSTTPTVSAIPSDSPSAGPSISTSPSLVPSISPSSVPSDFPSFSPSVSPSSVPSDFPSFTPSAGPSSGPSAAPSFSRVPSDQPSSAPSDSIGPSVSLFPSDVPSGTPSTSISPSNQPSSIPSDVPSGYPSEQPSVSLEPSDQPSDVPSASSIPSDSPSITPSYMPSTVPSNFPTSTIYPSDKPSQAPSGSMSPSLMPSDFPSVPPSSQPSVTPSEMASDIPSGKPSEAPSSSPSFGPSHSPSSEPSSRPSTTTSETPTPSTTLVDAQTKPPALLKYYEDDLGRTIDNPNPLLRRRVG